MSKQRMGGMKLTDFGKTPESEPQIERPQIVTKVESRTSKKTPPVVQEKLVTVNIKITATQHEWLNDTARQVRDNNVEPVPSGDRVYPQHLIGAAIELLRSTDVDWSQVRNVEELRKQLNL